MTHKLNPVFAAITVACAALSLPVGAASSTASSASESIATSVGSLSGSIENSSKGSSKATGVAEGDYRLIEVAELTERPGLVRMTLQAIAQADADNAFFLYVPKAVADQTRLAKGDTVNARTRPYGVEFAQGQPREAFFLVLADEWLRELQTTPVAL